jgi:hypothetical protein
VALMMTRSIGDAHLLQGELEGLTGINYAPGGLGRGFLHGRFLCAPRAAALLIK